MNVYTELHKGMDPVNGRKYIIQDICMKIL